MRNLAILLGFLVTACEGVKNQGTPVPLNSQDQRDYHGYSNSSLLDEGEKSFSLKNLIKGNDDDDDDDNDIEDTDIWNQTIAVLSAMPLDVVDSDSGIIATEWYENPNDPGERIKVNAIVDEDVDLKVFKQIQGSNGWKNVNVDNATIETLRAKILAE